MQKGNRISSMGEQASKSHMNRKKHISNSKPVPCFFKSNSDHVDQPFIIDIDGGPSGNSVQPLNVSISQE